MKHAAPFESHRLKAHLNPNPWMTRTQGHNDKVKWSFDLGIRPILPLIFSTSSIPVYKSPGLLDGSCLGDILRYLRITPAYGNCQAGAEGLAVPSQVPNARER
jgi:hypothetical protein